VKSLNPPSRQEEPVPIIVEEEGKSWSVGPQRRFFLTRIVQEAVNNACKHARAPEIRVRLRWTRFRLYIDIEDEGRGFDLGAAEANEGFGMGAMHRMAKAGRLRLTVTSEPGTGTQVNIEAPRVWL
jgi:two-component system sensor histidine kinase DegS